jgi:rSAM/selenodomain-associated transferase 1
MTPDVALIVIAKEPLPGRAKTRLCPPCTPVQAAALAAAALTDTLRAVLETPASRRVLVFEGDGERYTPPGFELIRQHGAGLADRLASAFEDVGQPAVLVGMDTPQVRPTELTLAMAGLHAADAVLGPAPDGGYWCLGLNRPSRAVFQNIPMSQPNTCAAQRARIAELGLKLRELSWLRDVDTIEDALAVAEQAPASSFAAELAELAGLAALAGLAGLRRPLAA